MQLYRVPIKILSPLATSLKGDTIWGHVVWGIANREGDEAVNSFLSDCKKEEPSFITFSAKEFWVKPEQSDFDIYVLSSYSKERIIQLFEWAFENGFGANSSTGKGKIEVLKEVEEISTKLKGKKYMTLAPFVLPEGIEPWKIDLRSELFVRSGKIGGAFVSDHVPWKKTVVLYDEGAVFNSEKPVQFIGKLIAGVHQDEKICNAGFAPVIPIE